MSKSLSGIGNLVTGRSGCCLQLGKKALNNEIIEFGPAVPWDRRERETRGMLAECPRKRLGTVASPRDDVRTKTLPHAMDTRTRLKDCRGLVYSSPGRLAQWSIIKACFKHVRLFTGQTSEAARHAVQCNYSQAETRHR